MEEGKWRGRSVRQKGNKEKGERKKREQVGGAGRTLRVRWEGRRLTLRGPRCAATVGPEATPEWLSKGHFFLIQDRKQKTRTCREEKKA